MKQILSVFLAISLLLLSLPSAQAADQDPPPSKTLRQAKVVGKAALYGWGGGLVVGLASQVFQRNAKNVFLFGSLGMYAGILLGIYVISTSPGPAPYEGPDTYDDFSYHQTLPDPQGSRLLARRDGGISLQSSRNLHFNFMNVRF
jgi:hypothetical protein